jgi:hypothetical protein
VRGLLVGAAILQATLLTVACGTSPLTPPQPPVASSDAAPSAEGSSATLSADPPCRSVAVAAGDIVNDITVANQTGRLAATQQPDVVLVLGDNQYPDGSLERYRRQYDRTAWGRLKPITKPVPGNHEYRTPGAAGYFRYFDQVSPYYAYDAGCGWRGYALNSETSLKPQLRWLRRDLGAHPDAPVLASWHKPRWSSGEEHGSDASMEPFWDALATRTGVVLNGHEHNYERFGPRGRLREFVVGTGGSSRYGFGPPVTGSERRIAKTPGVLRLDLEPNATYRWTFLDTKGTSLDSGTA